MLQWSSGCTTHINYRHKFRPASFLSESMCIIVSYHFMKSVLMRLWTAEVFQNGYRNRISLFWVDTAQYSFTRTNSCNFLSSVWTTQNVEAPCFLTLHHHIQRRVCNLTTHLLQTLFQDRCCKKIKITQALCKIML